MVACLLYCLIFLDRMRAQALGTECTVTPHAAALTRDADPAMLTDHREKRAFALRGARLTGCLDAHVPF